MADLVDKKEIEVVEKDMEAKNMENKDRGVSSVDLPAPDGWKKKFVPKKSGTPIRNKIIFISPTGEEITNKRQLDQFLKAHPGPSAAEFDWTPGSTPRRSARISEKSKATESPENEPGQKRERKSSKGAMENSAVVAEEAPKEEENAAGEEIKESTDVEMKEVEGGEDKNADKITTVEAMQEGFEAKPQETIPENSDSTENREVQEANLKNDPDAKEIQTEKTATPEVTETEIKESTDVEMKEVEGGEDKNADKITTVEAMQEGFEAKPQETIPENSDSTENREVQEANLKNDPDAKEIQTEKTATPEVTETEIKESTDVEMKEVEGGEDKNADKITTVEAMQEGFEAKPQETIPENSDSTENPEVQEANLKNDPDAKEIQTEKTATPEVTETESSEAPAPVTGSNGEAANEKDAKVGKESSEEDVMVGDVVSSENPTKGETLPDNNSNSKDTHLLNSEEAEDQLKAPPVSC